MSGSLRASRLTRRRRKVAELLAEGRSDRSIAQELGVDHKTIGRDRRALEAVGRQARALPPAPPGNQRALKHGANSELKLAPLRERFATQVRERWPFIDDVRAALLADRMARVEAARLWLDAQPNGVVRDDQGEVFSVVKEQEKWSSRVEQVIADLEAERRALRKQGGLAELEAHLAEINATDEESESG
jgi:hypothetical protein